MTLEALYYISQTIAVFAILGSLIILIMQQREARQRGMDESADVANNGFGDFRVRFGTEPELADLWLRGLFDHESLSPVELFRFRLLAAQILENTYILYRRYKRGTLSSEDWERHAAFISDGMEAPGIVQIWKQRRGYYPDTFKAVIDDLINAQVKTDIYPGLRPEDVSLHFPSTQVGATAPDTPSEEEPDA